MKKGLMYLTLTVMFLFVSVVGVYAASGNIQVSSKTRGIWETGWAPQGDFIKVWHQGYGYAKQCYGRMGADGTYSKWASATTLEAVVLDFGAYGSNSSGNWVRSFSYK